jgi:ribosomal protein S18 acetylase RimI-like enzyme
MIRIERAAVEQVEQIKRFLDDAWLDSYGQLFSLATIQQVISVWHDPKLLSAQVQDPALYFAVARNEANALLGVVTAIKVDDASILIDRLYVHGRHQREGIGSSLLRSSLQAYPGITRVSLEVFSRNYKGVSFYFSQGFNETGKKEERIGEEILESLIMEKQILDSPMSEAT